MAAVPRNPHAETCPDYSAPDHRFTRLGIITLDEEEVADVQDDEQAAEFLAKRWRTEHEARCDMYDEFIARQEEEEQAAETRRQELREAEEAEARAAADIVRKEREKKRTPFNKIDMTRSMGKVGVRPPPFAMEQIDKHEYVAMAYFLPDTIAKHGVFRRDNAHVHHYELGNPSAGGPSVRLTSGASASPIPGIRSDVQLTFEELRDAYPVMLDVMKEVGHYGEVYNMMALFYAKLTTHSILRSDVKYGKETLVDFQASARFKWYEENKAGNPFNLAIIDDDAVKESNDNIRQKYSNESMARYVESVTMHYPDS
ncbi:hypothetical protein CYLTODRAFT_245258 [Cylindrobasidium torrendii FP15055 ss-10]|uniref:Uncharacterized protein n=1 Tax=Cylindrobasidium torrendii FP15055 ss-10 TaxID=1314674 RepID=A0A0D7BEM8_9AGAR|nr:hypothetical protein CYLTODRAFT_245258 [Cylindrobasidium torrendii FP15055 ss-10]